MKTLVIGGARSGKSRYAEAMLLARPDTVYVATGYPAEADDADWAARVALHRSRRPSTWGCLETVDLPELLGAEGGPLLIDCLTLWLTRTMDSHDCWTDAGRTPSSAESNGLAASIGEFVEAIRTTARDVVLVTNEVGQGVVSADPGTRRFVDEMGALNTAVAEVCDDVVWCVAGRTVRL